MDERDRRYEQRFLDQEKAVGAALASSDKAVTAAMAAADKASSKIESAMSDKFKSVNEFRQTLSDQTATFMPRAETQALIGQLQKEVQELKDAKNNAAGESKGSQLTKSSLYAGLAAVATGLGIIVVIANNVF